MQRPTTHAAIAVILSGCAAAAPAAPASSPSARVEPALGYADVRPILEQRCFGCHAGEGAAAHDHDFSKESVAVAQRLAIAAMVRAGAMPPAPAPGLEDREKRALEAFSSCCKTP